VEARPINDVSYEAYLGQEKLMGSKCMSCGALFLPPRPICTECHKPEMDWEEVEGKGKLVSFTCIAVGPPSMKEEGFDRNNPYCLGIVEFEKGVRVVARVQGVETRKPETIRIGMPLRVKFLHRGQGETAKTVLAFEPV
jgi:scaffold protein (connect acetoacetyl-CoA thiolase and HMG-CoA synthase)